MLIFGHIGVGKFFIQLWQKCLPMRLVVLGTLLPDLIDKPLYYVQVLFTGKRGLELGLISGTRTIGHTLLFFILLVLVARITKSRSLFIVVLGVFTHLFLDNFLEPFRELEIYSSRIALLFPLYGFRFPVASFSNLEEHLLQHLTFLDILGECIGASILLFGYYKKKMN